MPNRPDIFRCVIPAGTKCGNPKKSAKAKTVYGIGERPGEQFAALNLLHQIERGKPMERLLAPEFREIWLDMDNRFLEVEADNEKREERAEVRKKAAQKRERIQSQKESISISTASRQIIEDALLETNVLGPQASTSRSSASSNANGDADIALRKQWEVKNKLVRMGFTELDSQAASSTFSELNDALDYLCLNLDESELPKSFTPTADIEVVQFYSKNAAGGARKIEQKKRDIIAEKLCVSHYSAEKALKNSDGDDLKAMQLLYRSLTRASDSNISFGSNASDFLKKAEEERAIEAETMEAIYGDDVTIGIGVVPEFDTAWAAVVRLSEGSASLRHKAPLSIVVLDVDGLYPLTAPVVYVTDEDGSASSRERLSSPQKRAAARALHSVITSHRLSSSVDQSLTSAEDAVGTHVIHEAISFLQNATPEDVLKAASECQITGETSKPASKNDTASKPGASGKKPNGRENREHRVALPRAAKRATPTPQLRAITEKRKSLPAFQSRAEILNLLRQHQVIVVSGATGSGKTTQIPQFILEDAVDSKTPISIVCTQPRRIAALSVAERVAKERGEKAGESVGFQVKLHSKKSRDTRLLFCTTGVLLRRLQSDHTLEAFTHVVVDEVHERSVDTDFLLLLLRNILRKRRSLRLVLMSATLDAEKFSDYFSSAFEARKSKSQVHVPVVSIAGRTFPVDHRYLADCVALTSYRISQGSRYAKKNWKRPNENAPNAIHESKNSASAMLAALEAADGSSSEEEQKNDHVPDSWEDDITTAVQANEQIKHPKPEKQDGGKLLSPVACTPEDKKTIANLDESVVNVDLISQLVRKIDSMTDDDSQGAILIFLPGAADISNVVQHLSRGSSNRLWALPLHSMLSPDEQAKVFLEPPKGMRKVICASNIAETSITVEDVTVVIDSLKEKEMSYDALNNTSVLKEQFISKAAAKQRAGRAGRVARGTCYRLVRQHTFDNRLAAQQTPEIQRVSLEHVILNFLSIADGIKVPRNPHIFLARAMDPPKSAAITSAVTSLVEIGALRRLQAATSGGHDVELTALGMHLTGLPVDARIGKLLIFGVLLKCVDASLTIAASISERSPFFSPFDKRNEARAAREAFAWGKSDLLTYVRAFNKWREVRQMGGGFQAEREFCDQNFLSRKTLLAIRAQREQLANALLDAGFGSDVVGSAFSRRSHDWVGAEDINENSNNARVVRAMVCAALYPNIMRIDSPNKTYHEVIKGAVENKMSSKDLKMRSRTGERLFLHPESINFHEGNYSSRWLAYFAKVKTSRIFVRDATMVSPYALLLFGGDIDVLHERGEITVDAWMYFKAPARVAVLVRELRRQLDGLLQRKFENPGLDLNEDGRAIHDAITRLIKTES